MVSGILMIAVGIAITAYLEETTPMGETGMTEDEIYDFLVKERENTDYKTLSGMLIGVGFLLLLISSKCLIGSKIQLINSEQI